MQDFQINKSELTFSITARTALLLGRENISSSMVAVLELVKNAYDADAKTVTIRFRKASTAGGTIEIIDDGHGMSWDDLQVKWMVIGTDNKQVEPTSPGGRLKAGEKGIGRFALDRLASQTIVETTPLYEQSEPTYRLTIDWDKFANTNKPLHKVRHPVEILEPRKRPGTRLILSGLRDLWTQGDYERLFRDLVKLIPPFEGSLAGFSLIFDCDEAPELSGRIRSPMAEAALFKMRVTLDNQSQVNISITTRDDSPDEKFRPFKRYKRTWQQLFEIPEDKKAQPECGGLELIFYFYLREASGVRGTDITLKQLRDYLDIYGGIRILRDGFRVKPYGDPGGEGDWLGLSARRVKHPAGVKSRTAGNKWVVAENQVAAGVFISRNTNPNLKDQTNREGLINNQAFRDMRGFVLKCIEVFETDRRQYELSKLSTEAPTVGDTIYDVKQELVTEVDKFKQLIDSHQEGSRKIALVDALQTFSEKLAENLTRVETTYETEQQETITKLQLLQNAATIGIAVSAMGHEVLETSRHITDVISRLQKKLASLMLITDDKVEGYMERLHRYGQIMYSVSNFALGHIGRDKRTRRKLNIDAIIEQLYEETLIGLCATNKASIIFKPGAIPEIYAFPYEIESIIINFVTNSLAAFRRGRTPITDRKIEIETKYNDSSRSLQIIARDSGPGIPKGDINRIFEVYSTKVDEEGKPIGTGLGLVIVKDIVESHSGTIEAIENGSVLAGAEFIVTFPVPRERNH